MRGWILLGLGLVMVACGRPRAESGPPTRGLEVSYGVDAMRPREGFELTLKAEGLTRLTLRRPWRGEQGGAVGFFAVRPKPEERSAIERVVRDHSLLDRDDEPGFTAEGSGHLRLAHGARRAEVSLVGSDEGMKSLRLLLDGLIESARQRPLAALKLVSRARVDGPNAVVDAALVHQGVKPLELAVYEPKLPDGTLTLRVVFERAGRLSDERFVSREDLAKLVGRKKLPAGWHALAPGERLVIELPLVRLPAAPEELTVRVEATVLARLGGEKAELSLSSAAAPLEPEAPAEE